MNDDSATNLNVMADEACKIAKEHGFWDQAQTTTPVWSEKIALLHSEVSEMLEALRDGDEDKLAEESADVLIRLLDFTGRRGIDLDHHYHRKMEINRTRPYLHGGKKF
jgi:NTP pyrophosphatase (non-canonical NTP hydrolase)